LQTVIELLFSDLEPKPYILTGTWELGRKDYLYRNVYNLRRSKGETFDIIPRFFILPRDYDDYLNDLERNPGRLYIQKVRFVCLLNRRYRRQ
jgi:hypothetical protein